MGTPYEVIYDTFCAQITTDEWEHWEEWQRQEDWKQLMMAAISWFKFPRISLETVDILNSFKENLTNDEIQVIIAFMKSSWIDRVVLDGENLKPYYAESDFSPSAMLDKFQKQQSIQLKIAKQLEAKYYRSVNGKPFAYSKLAGGGQ